MSMIEKMLLNESVLKENDASGLQKDFLDYLDSIRQNPNNFSYWYPKIKGVKEFCVPDAVIISVPSEICDCFFAYDGYHANNFQEKTLACVEKEVMPKIPDPFGSAFLFMKNGTFSNKYDANTCFVRKDPYEIMMKLIELNYGAIMLGAGGITEVVFRQAIHRDSRTYACIYNGLPLRPEFRVFYDFDKRKILYTANYWDWDYCYAAIARNTTDRIIYESTHPYILDFYEKHVCLVEEKIAEINVDLVGKWSIDIMYDEISDAYYLIDMALAEQSAYWDPSKASI